VSRKNMKQIFVTVLLLIGVIPNLEAQDTVSIIDTIPSIELSALRIESNVFQSPYGIYEKSLSDPVPNIVASEIFNQIPGLFILNQFNHAQDLRISIRGFGSRAAFGIRGVKLLLDGIPLTTADGQGQIDNLDLNSIQKISLSAGPASFMFGNASGGVLSFSSQKYIEKNTLSLSSTFGSFNSRSYLLNAAFKKNKNSFFLDVNRSKQLGYREHSSYTSNNYSFRIHRQLKNFGKIHFSSSYYNSPEGQDPGGVNLDQRTEQASTARDRNVLFNAGEEINQFNTSLSYAQPLGKSFRINSQVFYSNRIFKGRLPFTNGGVIDLNRNFMGHSTHIKYFKNFSNGAFNNFTIGYDLANQKDDRQRFLNEESVVGDVTLNQLESFQTVALSAFNQFTLDRLLIHLGIRYDQNYISVEDAFLTDDDDSGRIDLSAFNPGIGINYKVGKNLFLRSNLRTSFETPTLNELSNNPTGNGGFNQDLNAQKSRNLELGISYFNDLRPNSAQELSHAIQCNFYRTRTTNDIINYELEDFPGRSFYRNAGSSIRQGLEFSYDLSFNDFYQFSTNYSFIDPTFISYSVNGNSFDGNVIPGISKHFGGMTIKREKDEGFNFSVNNYFRSKIFLNDENSVEDAAFYKLNISLSYKFLVKDQLIQAYCTINNITNSDYNDNIRINAFGGRYYEAAPGRAFYGGIKLRLQ